MVPDDVDDHERGTGPAYRGTDSRTAGQRGRPTTVAQPTPGGRVFPTVRADSRTIRVVDDGTWRGLGQDMRSSALRELARVFSFVGQRRGQKPMTVALVTPASFPTAMAFTDAVVTLVDLADDLAAHVGEATRRQGQTAVAALAKLGVAYKRGADRIGYHPDRGGLTARAREVIPVRGGAHALYIVSSAVAIDGVAEQVTDYVDSLIALPKAKARRHIAGPADAARWMTARSLLETAQIEILEGNLNPAAWPAYRDLLGTALGRVMAHEVRHQYVDTPHHSDAGLGADAALITDGRNYGDFSPADQTSIIDALMRLERMQGKNAVIPMNPQAGAADAFPY